MHRTSRLTLAAAGIAALTACGTTTGAPAPATSAPALSAPSTSAPVSPVPSTSPSRSAAPATSGPKLVKADLSELKYYDLALGVPVVITTSLDAGTEYYLDAQPDGSVDVNGTAPTESSRMTLKPARVRKRTEDTKNTVVIVASPAAATSETESCVTEIRKAVLAMQPCRPGDAEQAWRLVPAGDSGLFELFGRRSEIRYTDGKIRPDGDWSVFQTTAVKP
jgi:eukaryotic-like serine/threonine-protein kinase